MIEEKYDETEKGIAVYETSSSDSGTTSWDGDKSKKLIAELFGLGIIRTRGEKYDSAASGGIFSFGSYFIDNATTLGFRAALTGLPRTASEPEP